MSLVCRYKFDEGTGSTALDSVSSRDGAIQADGNYESTIKPNIGETNDFSLIDPTTGNHAVITTNLALDLLSSFPNSITMWVYFATAVPSSWYPFADQSVAGLAAVCTASGGAMYWECGDGVPGRSYTLTTTILPDVWNLLAFVRDNAADSGQLYINTILETSFTGDLGNPTLTGTSLGLGPAASSGYLDDFRIYDHALSLLEVEQLYQVDHSATMRKSSEIPNPHEFRRHKVVSY